MSGTTWVRLGAILGGLSVVMGAFGAHGLEKHLSEKSLEVFETAAKYQMYHALALVAVGLMAIHGRSGYILNLAGGSFLVGILLFSGSLYALALTEIRQLGMITPIGGIGFIVGWFVLAIASAPGEITRPIEP